MKPLVVLGDTLLDVDAHGTSERLCPEAPVPVVDLTGERARPGGAGLAGLLAARSGEDVRLITALGSDGPGRRLRALCEAELPLVPMPLVGSTVAKTRVRVGAHSLLRLDSGDGRADHGRLDERVLDALRGAGAVLVSDYGRGVAAHPDLRRVLAEVAGRVPVVWDPHPKGAPPITGARLVTPNEAEATRLFEGGTVPPGTAVKWLAERLRRQWRADSVAVTLGSRGALLWSGAGPARPVPAARSGGFAATDTCGAGDRFASAAALALRAGAGTAEAVRAAVAAATEFVLGGGVGSLTSGPAQEPAPIDEPGAFAVAERVRRAGGRLVATGGCFDLLHPGHTALLRQARALGDALVVCLNSDASVRRAKGPGRPLVSATDRARLLTELSSVDAVLVFDEPTPAAVLSRLRPDVWVKGGDYAGARLPEAEVVCRHGGEVVLVPTLPGYSTTRLLDTAVSRGVHKLERI